MGVDAFGGRLIWSHWRAPGHVLMGMVRNQKCWLPLAPSPLPVEEPKAIRSHGGFRRGNRRAAGPTRKTVNAVLPIEPAIIDARTSRKSRRDANSAAGRS